jgi:hypothetical protein
MVFVGNRRVLTWPVVDEDRLPRDLSGEAFMFGILKSQNDLVPILVKSSQGLDPKVSLSGANHNLISVIFEEDDFWDGSAFINIEEPGRHWYTLKDSTAGIVIAYGELWITWAAARG